MNSNATIYFDLDGTIFDLYGVPNWLERLRAEDATPYLEAEPLVDLIKLADLIKQLQAVNIKIGVISWLAKDSSKHYKNLVRAAKREALKRIQVEFDEVHLVQYGTPKHKVARNQEFRILIDDDENVVKDWYRGKCERKMAIKVPQADLIVELEEMLRKVA